MASTKYAYVSIPTFPGPDDTDAENADAVVVMTLDGGVLQWDEGAERLFGYDGAEAIGHSIFELIVLADQTEGERQLLEETAEEDFSNYECIYRRKDGSMLYVLSTSKVLSNPETGSKFIVSGKTDVTQFTLDRDMKQVGEKFGGLMESMPDGVIMTNLTGHIVLANTLAEKLFGYENGELLGQPVEVLMPERFRGAHRGQRNGYFANPHIRLIGSGIGLYALRKDGTEFPAEISLSPLQPENSTVVVSAIRDISDRKKAE